MWWQNMIRIRVPFGFPHLDWTSLERLSYKFSITDVGERSFGQPRSLTESCRKYVVIRAIRNRVKNVKNGFRFGKHFVDGIISLKRPFFGILKVKALIVVELLVFTIHQYSIAKPGSQRRRAKVLSFQESKKVTLLTY